MTTARRERLAETLRNEISILLRREIRDPRVGFVTLTGATVSPDLSQAWIYVTVLGSDSDRAQTLEALNGAAGYLRKIVFKQLRLRRAPRLQFVLDESSRTGGRIEELLEEIHNRKETEKD